MRRPCLPSPSVGVDRGRRCWALRVPNPNNVALKRGAATHGLCGGLGREAPSPVWGRSGVGHFADPNPHNVALKLWSTVRWRQIHSASQRSAIAWK